MVVQESPYSPSFLEDELRQKLDNDRADKAGRHEWRCRLLLHIRSKGEPGSPLPLHIPRPVYCSTPHHSAIVRAKLAATVTSSAIGTNSSV